MPHILYKTGIAITVIVLLVGMSVIPSTGSIIVKKSIIPTFYVNGTDTFIKSIF